MDAAWWAALIVGSEGTSLQGVRETHQERRNQRQIPLLGTNDGRVADSASDC